MDFRFTGSVDELQSLVHVVGATGAPDPAIAQALQTIAAVVNAGAAKIEAAIAALTPLETL